MNKRRGTVRDTKRFCIGELLPTFESSYNETCADIDKAFKRIRSYSNVLENSVRFKIEVGYSGVEGVFTFTRHETDKEMDSRYRRLEQKELRQKTKKERDLAKLEELKKLYEK